MMKKYIALLLVILVSVGLLTACAAGDASYWANESMRMMNIAQTGEAMVAELMPADAPQGIMLGTQEEVDMSWDYTDEFFIAHGGFDGDIAITPDSAPFMPEVPPIDPDLPTPPQIGAGDGFAERIIHTATASIETLDFVATIDAVYQMLAVNGGFVESSEIGGISHWQIQQNLPSDRSASFTLRVPQERLAAMTGDLEILGNVLFINNMAENITAQFVDTEARLSTLLVQEERLLQMLDRAEWVSDLIELEHRLGEVRFQIESMVSTLRNWENRIRFSTLHLFIQEVHELTEVEERNVPYWQQVWSDLMDTFRDIGQFFMNLLRWFIVNFPILIIIVVVSLIVLLVLRRVLRKNRKRINNVKTKLISIPKAAKNNNGKNDDSDDSKEKNDKPEN